MFTHLWTVQPVAGRGSVADPGTGAEAVSGAAAAAAPAAAAASPEKCPMQDILETDQAVSKGYLGEEQIVCILLCTAGNQRGFCSLTVTSDFFLKAQTQSV